MPIKRSDGGTQRLLNVFTDPPEGREGGRGEREGGREGERERERERERDEEINERIKRETHIKRDENER